MSRSALDRIELKAVSLEFTLIEYLSFVPQRLANLFASFVGASTCCCSRCCSSVGRSSTSLLWDAISDDARHDDNVRHGGNANVPADDAWYGSWNGPWNGSATRNDGSWDGAELRRTRGLFIILISAKFLICFLCWVVFCFFCVCLFPCRYERMVRSLSFQLVMVIFLALFEHKCVLLSHFVRFLCDSLFLVVSLNAMCDRPRLC